MASIITIKCLKTIIRNENVFNIYIIINLFKCYNFIENRMRQLDDAPIRRRANFTACPLCNSPAIKDNSGKSDVTMKEYNEKKLKDRWITIFHERYENAGGRFHDEI